jgi:ribA/ribD-fused uncharacterized protein
MRETEDFYFFLEHQFGQWTRRDIVDIDDMLYNCCEQYMMYKKAILFNDREQAEKILQAGHPREQQELGRGVKGFQSAHWNQYKFGIVWNGDFLKFIQHEVLKERLLATEKKTLVEASPYGLVWGVGLAADDDRILDPKNWAGKNLLGKVLMSARTALQQQ